MGSDETLHAVCWAFFPLILLSFFLYRFGCIKVRVTWDWAYVNVMQFGADVLVALRILMGRIRIVS